DLPAEAPGADRRVLPVVLDETDVVPLELDPEVAKRVEVDVEHVRGGGLEDDLVLVELLEPKRVLAVAPVARPDGRLHVRRAPRLRPEAAQEGGRVHRPRA